MHAAAGTSAAILRERFLGSPPGVIVQNVFIRSLGTSQRRHHAACRGHPKLSTQPYWPVHGTDWPLGCLPPLFHYTQHSGLSSLPTAGSASSLSSFLSAYGQADCGTAVVEQHPGQYDWQKQLWKK